VIFCSTVVLARLFCCTTSPSPLWTRTPSHNSCPSPIIQSSQLFGRDGRRLLHYRRRGESVVQSSREKNKNKINCSQAAFARPIAALSLVCLPVWVQSNVGHLSKEKYEFCFFWWQAFLFFPSELLSLESKGRIVLNPETNEVSNLFVRDLCSNNYLSLFRRGKFVYFASTISLARFSSSFP